MAGPEIEIDDVTGWVDSYQGAVDRYVFLGADDYDAYRAAARDTLGVKVNQITGPEGGYIGRDGVSRRTKPGEHYVQLTIMPGQEKAFLDSIAEHQELIARARQQAQSSKPGRS
jgi:hypothetical protein